VLAAIAYHDLAFWDPRSHAYSAVVGWFFEASETSPQIVLGIVAGLLFVRRRQLREAVGGAASPWFGSFALALGVGFQLWAQWVDAPDLMVVSLGLVVWGAGLLLGGRPLARGLAAPLGILVLAIPFPGAFHNFVVYHLQLASAAFADLGLRALGFHVVLQSDILSVAGRKFEVIETCSGLRSIQTLLLLAAPWVVYFRCSVRHAACLLAATPLIAYLANGIRVMVLVLDPRPEIQESHAAQGILMFVVGTVALSGVDRVLIRLFRRVHGPRGTAEAEHSAKPYPRPGSAAVVLALLVMGAAALAIPGLRPVAPTLPPPPELPRPLAGWSVEEVPEPGHYLGSIHFTQRASLVYRRDGQPISVFLGWDDRRLRVRSLLSRKNAVPGSGWVIEQRGPADGMERVVAHRFAERSVTLSAYRGSAGFLAETLREALALDQPGSPFARPGRAGLLRVSTLVEPGPEGVAAAEQRLRGFLAELGRELAW
jgi:exosortase